ncbi:MAG: NUDIX domain-containing protein [Candidatus Daviesbacteria bacterium]|nr:NUDIX domain-containing protein [Candidatus Daviesbacteria bacterium]
MNMINKVALAHFKDKKMLMVRTKRQREVFYTLGGKIEKGESEIDCLKREVKEEISCELNEKSLNFLTEFEDVAHGKEDTMLHLKMYEGDLIGDPEPSAEIVEIGWFDTISDKRHLSEIAQRKIFPWLKKHRFIN